jgi:hypothetical protein
MNRTCFETVFKFFQFLFFPSAHKYIRHCDSYALNFLRSPEKISGTFILGNVSLVRTVGIVAVIIMLPVRLIARSLPFAVDIVAHSVICTR